MRKEESIARIVEPLVMKDILLFDLFQVLRFRLVLSNLLTFV
jgi:hypothetical protein